LFIRAFGIWFLRLSVFLGVEKKEKKEGIPVHPTSTGLSIVAAANKNNKLIHYEIMAPNNINI
jgi:hypothetical protein